MLIRRLRNAEPSVRKKSIRKGQSIGSAKGRRDTRPDLFDPRGVACSFSQSLRVQVLRLCAKCRYHAGDRGALKALPIPIRDSNLESIDKVELMKIGVLFGLLLIAGCSEPPPLPTLQQKWAKVQSLNVENATVDELVAELGAPYRSDDGAKQRSRFWYPFEGVTSAKKMATAPMLIVILDDAGAINSYMRNEPVTAADAGPAAELRIVPRDYKIKLNGKWKNRDLGTGKTLE
jgi:hypothetical protein